MKILSVVGARPNFMKIAPFIREINEYNSLSNSKDKIEHLLVHTGQHYDDRMSKAFFEALRIPEADINLGVGSGTHSEQVGRTMIEFEKVLKSESPDWVVVLGDVNATLACSVTAKKEGFKVCHIEAGLRSYDMGMPEEINRIVTDRLSDILLVPDRLSEANLLKEGIDQDAIYFVGNIMIDTLVGNREEASALKISDIVASNLYSGSPSGSSLRGFALITLHRPSNVDNKDILGKLVDYISQEVTQDMNVIWALHPRTRKNLEEFGFIDKLSTSQGVVLLHPLNYHEILKLNLEAGIVFTDSGGLQTESSVLGSPCLILRWNTEWIVTLHENGGNSWLVGNDIEEIKDKYNTIIALERKPSKPELWDGMTAKRSLEAIIRHTKQQ